MNIRGRVSGLARGAMLAGTLLALPVLAAPEEKENLYEVELIVFEQRLPELAGDELFADEPRGRSAPNDGAIAVEPPATGQARLTTAAEQLAQDSRYRLLAHERWIQPSEPKTAARPRRIAGAAGGTELDGNVRFYTTRFLHLDANLVLRVDGRRYQLNELRRLRLNELHYFDHPRFGVLARISPAEKEKPVR